MMLLSCGPVGRNLDSLLPPPDFIWGCILTDFQPVFSLPATAA